MFSAIASASSAILCTSQDINIESNNLFSNNSEHNEILESEKKYEECNIEDNDEYNDDFNEKDNWEHNDKYNDKYNEDSEEESEMYNNENDNEGYNININEGYNEDYEECSNVYSEKSSEEFDKNLDENPDFDAAFNEILKTLEISGITLHKLQNLLGDLVSFRPTLVDCCINSCVAFTNELINMSCCPECNEPRYKF
ncbi:8294_t:CDS:2, partial [Cetraspora pellucida]